MKLETKVSEARQLIHLALSRATRPVLYWSGGKDSTAMLHLVREVVGDIPVICHREPFFPRKYAFVDMVAQEWDLTIYDYPPACTAVVKNSENGELEVVNFYQTKGGKFMWLPTGVRAPSEGAKFLCGLKDLVQKPTAQGYEFQWDMTFIGHKSTDKCPIFGAVPLNVEVHQPVEGLTFVFPLKNWSDADVWDYIVANGVPYNKSRYDADNGFREFADHTFNPDYFPACTRCIDRDQPEMVDCPLVGRKVPNCSATVGYVPLPELSYIGGAK